MTGLRDVDGNAVFYNARETGVHDKAECIEEPRQRKGGEKRGETKRQTFQSSSLRTRAAASTAASSSGDGWKTGSSILAERVPRTLRVDPEASANRSPSTSGAPAPAEETSSDHRMIRLRFDSNDAVNAACATSSGCRGRTAAGGKAALPDGFGALG